MGMAPKTLTYPPGANLVSLATVTAMASGTCQVIYLGRWDKTLANLDIIVNVTTGYVAGTWAELAIYYGAPASGAAPATLTRVGAGTSVAGTFNSTGIKKTTTSMAGVPPESELWLVMGSSGGTQFQVRGCLADEIQSGRFCTVASRPTTSATINPTIGGAAAIPAWCGVYALIS